MRTRRVESFLLRIVVPEDQALTPEIWRGRIQHIASGSELQIDELAQALAFINSHLGPLTEYVYELEEPCSSPLP
ncbi:MAG: hypothetical protein WCG26_07830 [Chloroflexales bacterium]